MIDEFRRALLWSLILVFAACGAMICAQAQEGSREESTGSPQDTALRGVFLGKDNDSVQSNRIVGRLAILLKTGDGFQRVRSDHPFRSGDRFRFEITANQNGWLYVMHAAPRGNWQQLWPTQVGSQKVQSEQSYEIPPAPGIFIFDAETGSEFFYVAIRSDPTPPMLAASGAHEQQTASPAKVQTPPSKAASGETINFLIRDPFGETTRGVIFDPGKNDLDPNLYFSAASDETKRAAKIKFQLHHQD